MIVWQRIRQPAKKIVLKYRARYLMFKYEYRRPNNQSFYPFTLNLLVVKKPKYSELAQMCVKSFLHFHPNAIVILHCDELTYEPVLSWTKKSKFKNSIEVNKIYNEIEKSWQRQKLELIFSLSGTSEIFIDADMRWNGPLTIDLRNSREVYFFVNEFKLSRHPVFSKMLSNEVFQEYQNASMYNTSFVCLSGFVFSNSDVLDIYRVQDEIISYAENAALDDGERISMIRISEQLALSLAAVKWDRSIKALKETDGLKDGSFLESSYFGATGFQF